MSKKIVITTEMLTYPNPPRALYAYLTEMAELLRAEARDIADRKRGRRA